jgi:hypothetical protein
MSRSGSTPRDPVRNGQRRARGRRSRRHGDSFRTCNEHDGQCLRNAVVAITDRRGTAEPPRPGRSASTRSRMCRLSVRVNNRPPVKLIFDTAASHTVINADRAAALGVTGSRSFSGGATGGAIKGKMATNVTLAVEGAEVRNQPVAILDLPRQPALILTESSATTS